MQLIFLDAIKAACEIDSGVYSQVLQAKTLFGGRCNRNIFLKVNAKLGGSVTRIKNTEQMQAFYILHFNISFTLGEVKKSDSKMHLKRGFNNLDLIIELLNAKIRCIRMDVKILHHPVIFQINFSCFLFPPIPRD